MRIDESSRDGVAVITVAGRLDSGSAGELEAVLPARVQANARTVLDLSATAYVSSAGLRVLLIGAKTARSLGHKLALAGLSDPVREVFDISGFTSLFTIAPDLDSALAALA